MTERFLIWSIEHFAWWRPGECGYTPNVAEAGVYSKDDAGRIVQTANRVEVNECAIPLEATMLIPFVASVMPPASDDDLVMRFRNQFAELVQALPLDVFRDEKERRSTVVTMMLRAVVQELIAHLGPNHKAMSYVMTRELQRALDEVVDARKNPVAKH